MDVRKMMATQRSVSEGLWNSRWKRVCLALLQLHVHKIGNKIDLFDEGSKNKCLVLEKEYFLFLMKDFKQTVNAVHLDAQARSFAGVVIFNKASRSQFYSVAESHDLLLIICFVME